MYLSLYPMLNGHCGALIVVNFIIFVLFRLYRLYKKNMDFWNKINLNEGLPFPRSFL
jgi:hypothetical protein